MYINENFVDILVRYPRVIEFGVVCEKCSKELFLPKTLLKHYNYDEFILNDNIEITCKYCGNTHNFLEPIQKENNQYTPKCPTCSSPDIKRLSNTQKVTSAVAFGLFSGRVRKTFHCNNCKYEW